MEIDSRLSIREIEANNPELEKAELNIKVGILLTRLREALPQIPAFQAAAANVYVDSSRLGIFQHERPTIVFQLDGRTYRVNFFSNRRNEISDSYQYSAGIDISCYTQVKPDTDIDKVVPDHRFVLVESGADIQSPDNHSISYNNPSVSTGVYVSNRDKLFELAYNELAPILNFTNPSQIQSDHVTVKSGHWGL